MKLLFLIAATATLALTSCKKKGCTDINALNYSTEAEKDDGSCSFYEVPTSYEFLDVDGNSTVSYSGQTDRLNQLEEMTTYMKTGTGAVLDANVLKAMFRNTGDNGGGNFSFSSSKQLANKCFWLDSAQYVSWMDSIAIASVDFASTAANGQAGTLTSGTSTYLFDKNGVEYVQLIEKGLMGAVFMNQALNTYFGSGKMDVDNSTAVDPGAGKYYTEMEHHWDEAFGYFGAPVDFLTNTTNLRFWAKYCNSRDGQLSSNSAMMNAFLKGRTAIVNNDLSTRDDQIFAARRMWERFCAAQAVEYFTQASDNFGTDNAKYLHVISEAYAFIKCLTYVPQETREITPGEITTLLDVTIEDNFWNVTAIDITTAISDLNTIYGF